VQAACPILNFNAIMQGRAGGSNFYVDRNGNLRKESDIATHKQKIRPLKTQEQLRA